MEVLIASSILAFVVVALTQGLVAGQAHAYTAIHESRATSLLEATMAEVLRLPYADPTDGDTTYLPGAETGETERTGYDNLDDYDGWAQAAGSLTDLAGNAYPSGYAGFDRSVTVTEAADFVSVFTQTYSGRRLVVTVTDGNGRTWTLERYVSEPLS